LVIASYSLRTPTDKKETVSLPEKKIFTAAVGDSCHFVGPNLAISFNLLI
jgi:hypothetical protein